MKCFRFAPFKGKLLHTQVNDLDETEVEHSSCEVSAPNVDLEESTNECAQCSCETQKRAPPALPMEGPNLEDFAPSRGRDPGAILFMAASGTQPAGDALPSLLPSPILTMQDHVNFATILNPHALLLNAAVPDRRWRIGR